MFTFPKERLDKQEGAERGEGCGEKGIELHDSLRSLPALGCSPLCSLDLQASREDTAD